METNNYTTNVYKTSELKSPEHTYINHGYIDDVPIIEDNGDVVKIEVSGYTGYIKKQEDDGSLNIITVPMNKVNNLSHYTVNSNNELVHAIRYYINAKVFLSNIRSSTKFYEAKHKIL